MSDAAVTLSSVMTRCPLTVDGAVSVVEAARLMRTHGIRHLPVLEGGRLVGLVSDRDLSLVHSLIDVDPERIPVANAMEREPRCVPPETSLGAVIDEMAARKLGAVIVLDGEAVAGIFTTVDALAALGRLLRGEPVLHP